MAIKWTNDIMPKNISPIEVVLKCGRHQAKLYKGQELLKVLEIEDSPLAIDDESIDKIIVSHLLNDDESPEHFIAEARRILKRNGKIYFSFYQWVKDHPVSSWINQFKMKMSGVGIRQYWTIDQMASMIEKHEMLIDKNVISDNQIVYLEVIKIENDYMNQVVNL